MLLSLRHISFRGPIKRSRRELEKLFSRNDLYVKFVSTHVTTTNMYIAEAVDVELTELCYMNCIDKMCGCQRKPCTSCSLLVPSCCQLDHQFVCTRLTHTDYLVSCPTCGESLTRDAYYEHMNEYHLESIGAPVRQGRNDTTFWRCPVRGCTCSISVPTFPLGSLLLRLGRAKVSHLYHECQYNLVYDTTCGAFKRMSEMGNNRNDHSVDFEHIKGLHKQYQPQFDELLSNCTNIFEPLQHTREVRRTVQFLHPTVNSRRLTFEMFCHTRKKNTESNTQKTMSTTNKPSRLRQLYESIQETTLYQLVTRNKLWVFVITLCVLAIIILIWSFLLSSIDKSKRKWHSDFSPITHPERYCSAPYATKRKKSQATAMLFSVFIGFLGADRFYLGYTITGVIKLVTLGGFGAWWIIDAILVIAGHLFDVNGCKLWHDCCWAGNN